MVGCGRGCGLRLEMSLQMCVKERSSTGADLQSRRGGRESAEILWWRWSDRKVKSLNVSALLTA